MAVDPPNLVPLRSLKRRASEAGLAFTGIKGWPHPHLAWFEAAQAYLRRFRLILQ